MGQSLPEGSSSSAVEDSLSGGGGGLWDDLQVRPSSITEPARWLRFARGGRLSRLMADAAAAAR